MPSRQGRLWLGVGMLAFTLVCAFVAWQGRKDLRPSSCVFSILSRNFRDMRLGWKSANVLLVLMVEEPKWFLKISIFVKSQKHNTFK